MRRKEKQQPKERSGEGFAGREVLASIMDEEATGRFSLKQLREAAAEAALESPLDAVSLKDVICALPRPRSR